MADHHEEAAHQAGVIASAVSQAHDFDPSIADHTLESMRPDAQAAAAPEPVGAQPSEAMPAAAAVTEAAVPTATAPAVVMPAALAPGPAALAAAAPAPVPAWVRETQRALQPLVSFPPLKSKLLHRPPFAYLHDLLRGMRRHSALFDEAGRTGVPDDMWHIDALRAKGARMEFATRVLQYTGALFEQHGVGTDDASLPLPQPTHLVEVRECETTAAWLRRVAAVAALEMRPAPLPSIPSSVAATPQLMARYRSVPPSAAASPWPAARFNALLATPAGPSLPPRTPSTTSMPLAADAPASASRSASAICPPLFPLHESAHGSADAPSVAGDAMSGRQRCASNEFAPVPEEPMAPMASAQHAMPVPLPSAAVQPVQHIAGASGASFAVTSSSSSSAPPAVPASVVGETRQLLGLFLPPSSLTRERLRHPSTSLVLELLAHLADKTGFAEGVAPRPQDLASLADGDVAAQQHALERALRYVGLVAGRAPPVTAAQLVDRHNVAETHRLLQQLVTLALDPHLRLDLAQRRFDAGESAAEPAPQRAPHPDSLPTYVLDTYSALQSLLSSSTAPSLPALPTVAELSLVTFDVFHRVVSLVGAVTSFEGLVPADHADLRLFHTRANTPATNRAARLAFVKRIIGVVNGGVALQPDGVPVPLTPESLVEAGSPRGPVPSAEAAAASDYGRLVHALLQRLVGVASDANIDRAALLRQADESLHSHASPANGHGGLPSTSTSASSAASAAPAASLAPSPANGSSAFPSLASSRKAAPKKCCSLLTVASVVIGAGAIAAAVVWTPPEQQERALTQLRAMLADLQHQMSQFKRQT